MFTPGSIQWQVQHYGALLDDYQKEIDGHYFRQKIYKYQDRVFIETWHNGTTPLFKEIT